MSQEQIQVPKGWELVNLEEISEKITDGDHLTPQRISSGKIMLSAKNIRDGFIDFNNVQHVSESDFKASQKRCNPEKGDILLSCVGSIGRNAIVGANNDFMLVRSVALIKLSKSILSKYISYFLKSDLVRKSIEASKIGTGIKSLYLKDIKKIPIILPPLPTQKKIVQKLDDILGQVEEKKKAVFSIIDKNKEKIDLFEKNWITHIISNLIPRKELPDGWSLVPLSEICDVERGRFGHRPRNDPDYYGGKYPFIQTGNVANANGRVKTYSQTLNEKGLKTSKMFPKGTVVITIAANIGDTAILEFDACFPDSLIGITPIPGKAIPEYIEYALRLYQKELTRDASTGAQKNINYKFLKPLLIPIPKTIDMQKEIVQNIKNAEEKFKTQKTQFENIKENYENSIIYVNHIQSSILDAAFSGKLVQ